MIKDDLKKRFNYLIIDDFEQMRASFKGMLESFGAEQITVCAAGETALKALASENFDVVICDYNLGEGKDGQQVLEEARYLGYLRHASIFFMVTAESSMSMVLSALEHQPDEYMVKPINREVLYHRLNSAIKRKHQLKVIDDALSRGDLTGAIDLCDRHRGKDLKQSLYLAKLQAELQLSLHQYGEAERIYRSLLSIRDFHWARFGLGKIAFYLQDFKHAEIIFRELIEENDHYVVVYDWLASVLESTQSPEDAQQLLQQAVQISPKSVSRQRRLGTLALRNGQHEVAKKALVSAVYWGKNSCFASAEEFRLLGRIYQESGEPAKTIKLLEKGRKRFSHQPTDRIQMLCGEVLVKQAKSLPIDNDNQLIELKRLLDEHRHTMTSEALLAVAMDCFHLSQVGLSLDLFGLVVSNNHDNRQWIERVRAAMHELGQQEQADELICGLKHELDEIQARCVGWVRQGSLQEAIDLLNDTVDRFPRNRTLVLMAVQVMIEFMRKRGADSRYHFRCRHALGVLGCGDRQDPETVKYLYALKELMP
ncbi:MAG: response regulator [Candidatus Thiodiazotropha sp.]